MPARNSSLSFEKNPQNGDETLQEWRSILSPAVETLRLMAGTTEDQFLKLGANVQGLYQQSCEISQMSNRLIDIVSGDAGESLTSRLQQMIEEMRNYLASARSRSGASCETLQQVQDLLESLSIPLESFQKMNKTLRMLSISTKIESSRLGESGSGFVNLAMDVEKLSHQVNDKSVAIMAHRTLLSTLITSNLESVRAAEFSQDQQVRLSLKNASDSLHELVSVNERSVQFAGTVSSISADVTGIISNAVSLLQMHDMTRQQFEHVDEALEHLASNLACHDVGAVDDEQRRRLIVETGDVCELQEAQLRFASSELHSAVCGIMDNLRVVADRQQVMALETRNVASTSASGSDSFVDVISHDMKSIASILVSCAEADREMAETMNKVARTIGEIAAFVNDIEEVGTEIDLIALNAQIKAAHTGPEGAALGVLAEAIKRLSDEAVRQTDRVASILNGINSATRYLTTDNSNDSEQSGLLIAGLQNDLNSILDTLGNMNSGLFSILTGLNERVSRLTDDVEQTLAEIDVHERVKGMAVGVLRELEQIVRLSREIEPASSEFKQNLMHMEQRYTMESERRIHEAMERKRTGQPEVEDRNDANDSAGGESGFGDNVDLF